MEQSVVTVPKVVLILVFSMLIVGFTGVQLGAERKAKWFRKRKKYTMFTRRGFLGEVCHFGYPCTREGYMVFSGMVAAICLVSYVVLMVG